MIALAVAGLGAAMTYLQRWTCDDIYITFRYAEQFLAGNGWVYNAGERVEGYTHFLWLAIITASQRLGADPVSAVISLGVLSYVVTLLALARISFCIAPRDVGLVFPFAALALVANRDGVIWATGGLETSFFTALLVLAFLVYFFTGWRERLRLLVSSLLLVLSVMTRPDGVLFVVVAGVALVGRALGLRQSPRRILGDCAAFCAPIAVVYLPYLVWKVAYYGDLFPNPYYAKSAHLSYYSQGLYYLWLYWLAHPTSALCAYALAGATVVLSRRAAAVDGRTSPMQRADAAALVALAVVAVYLVGFVARVGGDFMFARFVMPVVPFGYFLFEWSLRRLWPHRARATRVVLVATVVVIAVGETALRDRLLIEQRDGTTRTRDHRGIVDEHAYYTRVYPLARDRRVGELLRPYFDGLDATVLLRGQACLGYYAGFRTCIDNSGLTDAEIAHRPIERRGRVGHEKSILYSDLVARGVNFVFDREAYKEGDNRLVRFQLPDGVSTRAEIITDDTGLMSELSTRFGQDMVFEIGR
ncbi:MAG TPA: hypothetical protein VFX92_01595 [Candidatus Krumholzibacteria bacterium]|nr:hypothetical protein [Candidatus Krumholzibacteria bacterium]